MSDPTPQAELTLRVMVERKVRWLNGVPDPASQANILNHLRDGLQRSLPPNWSIADGLGLTDPMVETIVAALRDHARQLKRRANGSGVPNKRDTCNLLTANQRAELWEQEVMASAIAYTLEQRLKPERV